MHRLLGPTIEQCSVQLVLSGHDHHQEHLSTDAFEQIVQGAAGRLRDVTSDRATAAARQRFAAARFGFATLVFTPTTIDVTFHGYPRGR